MPPYQSIIKLLCFKIKHRILQKALRPLIIVIVNCRTVFWGQLQDH